MTKLKTFWEESRQEFKRINWPTWRETRHLTFIVIGMAVGFSIFLGILDFAFGLLLKTFFL